MYTTFSRGVLKAAPPMINKHQLPMYGIRMNDDWINIDCKTCHFMNKFVGLINNWLHPVLWIVPVLSLAPSSSFYGLVTQEDKES